MRLYLDDDSASALLARLLARAGHDVIVPVGAGLSGINDPVHLTFAIRESRVLLTNNHRDFELLHELIAEAQGHHPGILSIRRDNDPKRDLTPRGIAVAINKLAAANFLTENQFIVLNHWR